MNLKALVLFDIDGVIRDVSNSYRLAVKSTVEKYCFWRPTNKIIDDLKCEGCWNNDWDASLELIKRHFERKGLQTSLPSEKNLIESFSKFYFGGDPQKSPRDWKGYINNEPLLVNRDLFEKLDKKKIGWGFVSGAEAESAKFVLETRLGLIKPPLIAMGDAPDKPNPTGFIKLATEILSMPLGSKTPPIAYLGDTVADVETVKRAKVEYPNQKFISLAIAPPHIRKKKDHNYLFEYEENLRKAGADHIFKLTTDLIKYVENW